jgi:CBS domain containing-hemolysin-like protein
VDSLAVDMPLPDLLNQISIQHRSRYPVYRESIDNVVGILHTKDLFDAIIHRPELLTGGVADFDLQSILRKPLFVPATVSVDKVLERMQRTKTHAAIVMDEYGGMAGMATMEDILEELVGEVSDEFDVETALASGAGDSAVLDGLVTMDDVIERFGKPDGEPRSTTIGGYVAERLGRIPSVKDKIAFGDYEVCVEEMDGMRVAQVRFTRRSREAAAEKNAREE